MHYSYRENEKILKRSKHKNIIGLFQTKCTAQFLLLPNTKIFRKVIVILSTSIHK